MTFTRPAQRNEFAVGVYNHGMARIRLGKLERVLVAFWAAAGVTICLSGGHENTHPPTFVKSWCERCKFR